MAKKYQNLNESDGPNLHIDSLLNIHLERGKANFRLIAKKCRERILFEEECNGNL